MPKILIDTNVWLRYLLQDSPEQYIQCLHIFEQIEIGRIQPYISSITLLEIVYTLKTFYKVPAKKIFTILKTIHLTRNLTILEKTDSQLASRMYIKTGVKYADCLIASQIKPGTTLVTYDRDFLKLIPKQTSTPKDLLSLV